MPRIGSFEKYSREYDKWFIKNQDMYSAELKAIKETVTYNDFGVEIGVGTGRFAVPLGVQVGLEPSKKMAEFSKKRGIQISLGVAEHLPFRENTFDFVLMITTLCFLDDVFTSFKEAHRILKNHGYLVVGFIDKKGTLGKQYQLKKKRSKFYQGAHFYSVQEVITFLHKVNLTEVLIKQTLLSNHSDKEGTVEEGYDKGSFVVIKAIKTETPSR